MARRLVALEKSPGVGPVVIGEAIRHLMTKLVQGITAHQAMEAYRSNNICAGLKAGIEREVHASKRDFEKKNLQTKSRLTATPREQLDSRPCGKGGSESTDPSDSDGAKRRGELITLPHWNEYGGEMNT